MWSVCDMRIKTLFCYFLSLSSLCSGYLITIPRRLTSGGNSQVCVILSSPATADETITFELKETIYQYNFFPFNGDEFGEEEEEGMVLIPPTDIVVPQGKQNICQNITLPPTELWEGEFTIVGSLEGQIVNYTKLVGITKEIVQTFIQTDKFLYKPSQEVQFRILSIFGPLLQVSLEKYKEIWIETPSGVRVAQWSNVSNDRGLIHLSFQLSDEPEEGEYKINVETSSGKFYDRVFKVEEYVLPRFEVTINPPKYILGTTEIITFEVCANYTFGQPVNGYASISVDNSMWWGGPNVILKEGEISGCTSFNFSASDLQINGPDYEEDEIYYYNRFVYYLIANAFVTEEGTGVILEANGVTVQISRTALMFKDISVQKLYKPELPYIGKVKVTFPDGSPATEEKMIVCCEDVCKNMSTDAEGILIFGVPPHRDCDIRISAPEYPRVNFSNPSDYNAIMYKSGIRIQLKKYHSPSNSSLIISLPNDELECTSTEESIDFDLSVTFAATQSSALVTIQIVSRGQIMFTVTFDQAFMNDSIPSIDESLFIEPIQDPSTPNLVRGYFTVPVSLPKTVSPEAKVLVWYVRDDGEVVSDARAISIMECLLNSVNVAWSIDKSLPGSNATVSVTAEPSSLCSLGVVDKSVELLTPKKYLLTIIKLLNIAQRGSVKPYDYPQVNDYEYCLSLTYDPYTDTTDTSDTADTTTPLPPTPDSTSSSSPPARRKKRAALPSNLGSKSLRRSERSIIDPWFPIYIYDDVDALYMCDEAGLYCLSNLTWETRPCQMEENFNEYYYQGNYFFPDYYDNYYGDYYGVGFLTGLLGGLPGSPEESPDDSETDNVNDVRTYFPETWIWDLIEVSDGSYEENVTLPDTVTEWVGSAICVHPSKGIGISNTASIITFKEFFIDLTLPPSVKRGEVFPVKISTFNYLAEPLPIILTLESPDDNFDILEDFGNMTGNGTRNICVPLKDKTVVSIRIQAKEAGDVSISVKAIVQANAVDNCGSGIVQQQSDSLIKPIRVIFEGFVKEETRFKYICTNESFTETWSVAAPGGSIVPDSSRGYVAVTGSSMGPTIANLGNLVNMPYGCGEQNMINFAADIFVLHYLSATDQDDEDIADKAIEFMEAGYQRQLNYRHSDGSFSAFGERDESGSTWLTAFVLKCFGQASDYITIDQNDLTITRDWLKSKQEGNGCFQSVGKLCNKAMQGGVESESPSLITAYVVISLIEAGENYDSTEITKALPCINGAAATTNPYSLAIKAYALALAKKSPDTGEILDRLMSLALNSPSGLYWEIPAEYESSKSVALETACYAVLAILTFIQNSMTSSVDYSQYVLPIIQWINTQRNGQGGFVSTQDTVMALQALAAFEETVAQGPVDLTVLVTMGSVIETFTINEQNKLLQQSVAFPVVPITVTFEVDGQGCVLLQAVLRYNVPEGEINEAFSLRVTTSSVPDEGCETREIEVCTSYLVPNQTSNMAIIEINLVSGYIPEKEDLNQINGTGLFKRYEVDGSKVIIYLDEISVEEICVSFRIFRAIVVQYPKRGTVRVYDYYKPQEEVSETFTLPPPTDCEVVESTTAETTTGTTTETTTGTTTDTTTGITTETTTSSNPER